MSAFWVFMLILALFIPILMVIFGKLFLKNIPKEINPVFGYRTTMPMKNKDTWEFAHKYCGKLWFRSGLVMLPLAVVPLLFMLNKSMSAIGTAVLIIELVQLIPMLVSIFMTEAALKKAFDKNGMRR